MEYTLNNIGLIESIVLKNTKDLNWRLTSKLKKKYGLDVLANILINAGFNVDKCKLCNRFINFNILFDDTSKDHLSIIGVRHLTKYSNYQYCYGFYKDCIGIKMNSNSAEFISKVKDITINDALHFIKKNNKSPFYKENHEDINDYKKCQSRNKDFFIQRYGEDDGTERWKTAQIQANYSRSLLGYIEKYGKIEGSIKWNEYQKSKDSMSRKLFNSDEEYNTRINSIKLTYDNFIKKYGEELGKIKWKLYLSNRSIGYSKWSINIIDTLMNLHWFKDLPIDKVYYATKNREYCICDETNKNCFLYDLTIFMKDGKRIIIEFNGNKFHANPNLSINERNLWFQPFSKESFDIVLNNDKIKKLRAESKGFIVYYVWDNNDDNFNINYIKTKIYELFK